MNLDPGRDEQSEMGRRRNRGMFIKRQQLRTRKRKGKEKAGGKPDV